ncbi:MAG: hypothetical protein ACFFB7_08360 [Candidatus Sifarchaeia archaeon]
MVEPQGSVETLEEQFINDTRKDKSICIDCFEKRFSVVSRERSDTGGMIFELQEKQAPRSGLGSSRFSCVHCDWVAWTEEGLTAHVEQRHKR